MNLRSYIQLVSLIVLLHVTCPFASAQERTADFTAFRARQMKHHYDGGYMWQPFSKASFTKAEDGTYRIIVVLAEYSDVSFFYKREHFEKMLNGEGYSDFGAQGSAREYLESQLRCKVEITITDIVKLSQTRQYYGMDSELTGSDAKAGSFVAEACTLAAAGTDFSAFDMNGDGLVDNVFVIFAGEDQAQCMGEHPEYMWSHSYNLLNSDYGKTLELGNISINNYGCCSELYRRYDSSGFETVMAPIGTFCHEYLHNLGLSDLYDTDYEKSGGRAAGVWGYTALMSSGNYNNNGNTPANLNAIDLQSLGVMEPEPLKQGSYTLYPLSDSRARTYIMSNPANPAEYYLFEARNTEGWDQYIGLDADPGVGMLVYHIDKREDMSSESETFGAISSYDRWHRYNEVNANPKHQCADLIEADGRSDINPDEASQKNIGGIFFPAYGASALGGDAKIPLSFWDGSNSTYAIRNIRVENGAVLFSCVDLTSPLPPPAEAAPKDDEMLYIIVVAHADGRLELSVSNAFEGTVSWYFDNKPLGDVSEGFKPSGPGMIRAEITWPDGSTDNLYKEQR